ncbi:MAG: TIGR04283 family arsenosugar biosynthesis glycosyltransferase [candidate division KSB1 bacterium]|nr:TIGR04283 family arsenosugar biosynthesis glycosyltransferase [candidate division KSB1 bacterium]MDZ7367303.1 TIGR04283 family arsenosugar biosynthesis glycosyltransferase [candidate division KSB1 bacterium]MDZ7405858.1 TIGR04283 family arsenosugar biosynthesis glycosyltransferase [candidate division KSB1 bacterium]
MKATITLAPKPIQAVGEPRVKPAFVSIIVPTLNEAQNVRRLASTLSALPEAEIIFCDGGSCDGTPDEIQHCVGGRWNVRLIHAPCNRAQQMNAGAKQAKGEWLIFLHADTVLPRESFNGFLVMAKQSPHLNAGAFTFRVAHQSWVYRYLEFYVGLRCKLLKLPFGDQAIFIRRKLFEAIGGYREDFPLMEDMEIAQRLNKQQGFVLLDFLVYTSARRYEAEGFFKRGLGNIYLQLLYRLGVHPRELAKKYWK